MERLYPLSAMFIYENKFGANHEIFMLITLHMHKLSQDGTLTLPVQ